MSILLHYIKYTNFLFNPGVSQMLKFHNCFKICDNNAGEHFVSYLLLILFQF